MTTDPEFCVVFGSLRSGTTMLTLMMDGHPRFVCPGESDFLVDHLVRTQSGGWRYNLDTLADDRIFQASPARLPDTEEAGPAFAAMIADLHGASGASLILVLHRRLGRLLEIAPDTKVLHLLRDPRDVARSAVGMGWAGNVYYGAITWLVTEQEWDQVSANLHSDQVLEFHYETLVSETEDVLSRICAFLGNSYDPMMLNYAEHSTYDPPDSSLINQWRHKQTARELGLVEPLFGELLTQRGYVPSGYPPITPTPLKRLLLKAEHLNSVWRRKIMRYGLRDPLLASLCKRLGMPALARPAQRRMDAITRQHLK